MIWALLLRFAVGVKINSFISLITAFALVNAGESIGIVFYSLVPLKS